MINFGSGALQRATMIPAYDDAPFSHQRSAPLAPPPSFVPEAYVSEADRACYQTVAIRNKDGSHTTGQIIHEGDDVCVNILTCEGQRIKGYIDGGYLDERH